MILGVFATAPANAVDVGCQETAQTATVFALAAAGEATGWSPECAALTAGATTNKAATLTFTNLDALFHIPAAAGCFAGAQINAGQSWSVSVKLIDGKVYNGFTPCDDTKSQARVGTFIPKSEGPKLPVIEYNEDGTVVVHFICSFHGPAMHGRMVITPA